MSLGIHKTTCTLWSCNLITHLLVPILRLNVGQIMMMMIFYLSFLGHLMLNKSHLNLNLVNGPL